jgi:ATP adenylyltransferase
MAYVGVDQPAGCIFCDKPAQGDDARNLILRRGSSAFVLLNAFPYNNGHLMVAPYRHVAELESLTAEECADVMSLTQWCVRLLRAAFKPDGFNVGMNLSRIAGAGIADHLHLHLVPRWNGDTNFMPVIGDTKVLPDSLERSYVKLREAIDQL